MSGEHRCFERLYGRDHGWRGIQCGRKGTVNEEGNWWCKTHAPSAVAARKAVRDARWNREAAISNATHNANYARTKIAGVAIAFIEGNAIHDDLAAAVSEWKSAEQKRAALVEVQQ